MSGRYHVCACRPASDPGSGIGTVCRVVWRTDDLDAAKARADELHARGGCEAMVTDEARAWEDDEVAYVVGREFRP